MEGKQSLDELLAEPIHHLAEANIPEKPKPAKGKSKAADKDKQPRKRLHKTAVLPGKREKAEKPRKECAIVKKAKAGTGGKQVKVEQEKKEKPLLRKYIWMS